MHFWTRVSACFGDVRESNENKQNILCLNTVQLSTYPPNKTIFLGTQLVGFVGAELVRSRVGKGPRIV